MFQSQPLSEREDMVREISTGLAEAADRLERADCLENFASAIEAHVRAWNRLCEAAATLRLSVPEHVSRFSQGAPKRLRRGLNDQDIEMLIRCDRMVSASIAAECPLSATR